jgi:amino acid transporter
MSSTLEAPDRGPPVVPEAPRRRRLTLLDVLAIGVNATVGSGVFSLPDDMQRAMGGWSPLAYVLCSLLLLPVALCFAEASGRFDESGGAYVYARRAFGDRVGFFVGWYCWAATLVSWAANATLFVALGLNFAGAGGSPWAGVISVGVVLALGAINYVGVKPGAWVVNVMVIGKLGAIFCFLGAAVFALDPGRLGGPLPQGLRGVGTGVYLALFPLQGFEVAPVAAGETANPRRSVPIGTMGALLLSALLFIVVQVALVASYPDLAADSQQPLVDAARHLGPRVGFVVLVGSLVSIGGFTAGSALGSPRYAEAIAAHGLLPSPLARVHPRWSTPYVSIVATTLLSAALAFRFDYRTLVGMANVTIVIQYFFTCIAVPVLRKKMGAAGERSWRAPGGVLVPAVGAAGSLLLFAGSDAAELKFAAGTLVVGVAIAVGMSRAKRR